MLFVSLSLFLISSIRNDSFFYTGYKLAPDISSPVYKPTQNPLRSRVGPGLINGILRYNNKAVSPESSAQYILLEWLHFRISSTNPSLDYNIRS